MLNLNLYLFRKEKNKHVDLPRHVMKVAKR